MVAALLIGFGLGFLTAIPIAGPVSAFVFSQGMRGKYLEARWAALGAALVEAIYTFLAFWGVNRLSARFGHLFDILNVFAAAILGILGVFFWRSNRMRRSKADVEVDATGVATAFILGASVSGANPSVIATWATVIASLYATGFFAFSDRNAALFSVGISVGIFTWFSIFLWLIEKYKSRFKESVLDLILKGVGVVLVAFSLTILFRLITHRA